MINSTPLVASQQVWLLLLGQYVPSLQSVTLLKLNVSSGVSVGIYLVKRREESDL